jgi:GAF domain-containing protein
MASAPIAQQVPIGSYIGVPLTRKDGSLFGTLCAIDPNPKDESICNELPLVKLLAKLLENTLDSDLKAL